MIKKIQLYFRLSKVIVSTIFFSIKAILTKNAKEHKHVIRKIATKWSIGILHTFKVSVKVEGMSNLDENRTYIFASNHSSMFDIPIMFSTFSNFNYVIIYKEELEKVPIFGTSLKASPFISIDRSNPRNAMASIEKTLNQMEGNDCPIIFPEGTRSEDGKLADFKRGAFLIASRSGKPIVPIAIVGSNNIMKKGSINVKSYSIVKVIIDPPIENKDEMDRIAEKELMKTVHSRINNLIETHSKI